MNPSRHVAALAIASAAAAGLAITIAPADAQSPSPSTTPGPGSRPTATMDPIPAEYVGDAATPSGTFAVADGWTITTLEARLIRTVAADGCAPATATIAVYPSNDQPPQTSAPSTTLPTTTTAVPSSTTTTTQPVDRTETHQAFSIRPACNGTYTLTIDLVADDDTDTTGNVADERTTVYQGAVSLSLRPVDVAATAVTLDDHAVTVSWQPAAVSEPDLVGYVIQRATPGADFADLASAATGARSFGDALGADAAAGIYRYRVLAERAAAAEGARVRSAGGSTTAGQVSLRPPVVRQPTEVRPATPPAPAPTVAITIPSTTIDEGYSETLDYGETAEEPEGDSLLDFVPSPGSGILVPFAIAECLAVWAMHLRYLARRADEL